MAVDFQTAFKGLATDETYVTSFSDIIKDELPNDEMLKMFTITNDAVTGKPLAVVDSKDKVVKADPGCGDTPATDTIPAFQQKWDLKDLHVHRRMCWNDFAGTWVEFQHSKGLDKENIGENEIGAFMEWYIVDAMSRDLARIALMGNASADTVANSSYLENTVDKADYNMIDKGLIATMQYFKTLSQFQDNYISLPQNEITTRQYQYDGANSTKKVSDLMFDLDDKAIRFDPNHVLMNYRAYQGYQKELRDAGTFATDGTREIIKNGVQNVPVAGYLPVTSKLYDQYTASDTQATFTGNATTDKYVPNFICMTTKDNLRLGFDKYEGVSGVKFILDEITGYVHIKAKLKLDFKIANPNHVLGAF